jgi:nucleoside-diphosphate-sugar epimerase
MYLGGGESVPGDAPSDPKPGARPPYARGKIAAEAEVQRLQGAGLETVVLRPAIVLGNVSHGNLSHGGVGLWVKDNICMGWGPGRVPLPLVSAADCAAAIVSSLYVSGVGGKTYALAGEVRPSAREFVGELGRRSGRPYRFLGQSLWFLWCVEMLKYGVKVLTRRPGRCKPSWRDLRSRGFLASLDCAAALRDLEWEPEKDREVLLSRVMDGDR